MNKPHSNLKSLGDDFIEKEFPMSNDDFSNIKNIAYSVTGIKLTDHKKNMIYGRLSRRLRRLGLSSFKQYCELIQQKDSVEITDFVNSITTNLTSFFREKHHFDFLKNTVIPTLLKSNSASKRIRIWSAGCSTGEEPYSIAMVLNEFPELLRWDAKILATDLDSNVVDRAKEGIYALDRVEKIPDGYDRFIQRNVALEQARIHPDVARFVTFKQLNLLHDWPMKGQFDVIFCRNVVIYFDAQTQIKLFDRYANLLTEQGCLFIGHSENLNNISSRFDSQGRTIYRKMR